MVSVSGELCQGALRPEPGLAPGNSGFCPQITRGTGGTDEAEEIESVPDAKDHGAVRIRSSEPWDAGHSRPHRGLQKYLADTAIIQRRKPGYRSSLMLSRPCYARRLCSSA